MKLLFIDWNRDYIYIYICFSSSNWKYWYILDDFFYCFFCFSSDLSTALLRRSVELFPFYLRFSSSFFSIFAFDHRLTAFPSPSFSRCSSSSACVPSFSPPSTFFFTPSPIYLRSFASTLPALSSSYSAFSSIFLLPHRISLSLNFTSKSAKFPAFSLSSPAKPLYPYFQLPSAILSPLLTSLRPRQVPQIRYSPSMHASSI